MERLIAAHDSTACDARREMVLQAALALSLTLSERDSEEVRPALARALALAEELGYPRLQLRLLAIRCHGISTIHRRTRRAVSAALARVLWLQGHAEQAVKIAREILDETAELGPHPISLGHCLFYTASVFVWSGDCPPQRRLSRD
jgi:hypothetical protein